VTASTVVVDERFRGPKDSGNGGYVCGLVAAVAGNPAEVRLRRPPPLARELAVRRDGDAVLLLDGDDVVAEGRPLDRLDIDVPPPVLHASAAEAARPYPVHPFPECFVCGPNRASGDGLRVFAGAVAGREGIFASPWIPDDSLVDPDDADGAVRNEFTWAALDCPTSAPVFPLPPDRAIVLGTLAVHLRGRPRVGYRYVVMSWLESSTEKVRTGCAAVLGETGDVIAASRGSWVLVDAARFARG
jgi:hypothetical protein